MSNTFPTEENLKAQQAAYRAVSDFHTAETSLVEYQSRGHVALIGDAQAIQQVGELPSILSSEVVLYDATVQADMRIEGALGHFVISYGEQIIKADLILDCSPSPVLTMALKPPGYFVFDHKNSKAIKDELENLVGTFEKPRYFNYNESACAHGRSGQLGCTRCVDACPAEAIISIGDSIEVNPYRCQGGGICASVCPSGAIRYSYPTSEDLLQQVRLLISHYLKQGGVAPELVFVNEAEQQRVQHALPTALLMVVEEVASVGPEVCLSALSWGARAVRLFDLDGMPASSLTALKQNMQLLQGILSAIQYPANAISIVSDTNELISSAYLPIERAISSHAALSNKRESFYMALDQLVARVEKVDEVVALSEGAIFGEVIVDNDSCTLCMSCVSACPANAFQDGSEKPQLRFIEAKCLQCGICANTCPEDAISLAPRLLLNAQARKKSRLLKEQEPFCCISCGKPFATQAGISTILSKLADHPMFSDERSLNRLKMCNDCRVIDMAEDPNTDF